MSKNAIPSVKKYYYVHGNKWHIYILYISTCVVLQNGRFHNYYSYWHIYWYKAKVPMGNGIHVFYLNDDMGFLLFDILYFFFLSWCCCCCSLSDWRFVVNSKWVFLTVRKVYYTQFTHIKTGIIKKKKREFIEIIRRRALNRLVSTHWKRYPEFDLWSFRKLSIEYRNQLAVITEINLFDI